MSKLLHAEAKKDTKIVCSKVTGGSRNNAPLSDQITIGRAPVGRDTTGRHGHGRRACSCPATIGTASSLELARLKPKRLPHPNLAPRVGAVGVPGARTGAARRRRSSRIINTGLPFGAPGHGAFRLNMKRLALARLPASRRDHATRSYARADGHGGRHHTKQPARQPG